jgi:nicotinamide mononucleotide (NMN) deamidase PncC
MVCSTQAHIIARNAVVVIKHLESHSAGLAKKIICERSEASKVGSESIVFLTSSCSFLTTR